MEITSLLQDTFAKVIATFAHNWYLLVLSIFISAALKFYVDQEAIARFLRRNTRNSVLVSTGIAVGTPFCSCGTTAVVLGMIASTVPWAPIVAFLVSSPLTSPQELFYSAGIFGWPFAIAFFVSSILLGLLGGVIASFAEARGWLANQARMAGEQPSFSLGIMAGPAPIGLPVIAQPAFEAAQCGCLESSQPSLAQPAVELTPCDCASSGADLPASSHPARPARPAVTLRAFLQEAYTITKRLIPLFFGFTFIGYLLNGLIPTAWVTALFGAGHAYSIPLAATLGLPFYLNTEASLPLVRAMMESGMSQGAALAFLITGAGTSLGALGGLFTIARWRVITMVIGTLWFGSILLGIMYDLLIM